MAINSEIDDCIRPLLQLKRKTIERCQKTDYALVSLLERDPAFEGEDQTTKNGPRSGPNHGAEVGFGNG